ncbi:hypothetical protein AD953_05970 [Acetobacter malorum]|uniref:Uncharacterized protein n=1 Tax=Acetobacter malorum TaxID=178901 RepID=A0A149V6R7_9PROT|nr:hypothetical protein [Acetobacter malorum]KXV75897.1 hypothetical protein AD953_05970 [Acetobacter malorum]
MNTPPRTTAEARSPAAFPGCPVRPVGITAKKYHFVDALGRTRVLSEHEISQRHIISGLFGDHHNWLLTNFPNIEDGEPTGTWSASSVSDWLKHRALSASFDIREQFPIAESPEISTAQRYMDSETIRKISFRVADFTSTRGTEIYDEVRKLAQDVLLQCHRHDHPLDLQAMLAAPEDEIINDLRVIRTHANNNPGQSLPAGALRFEVKV